jgi:hypothetical protein
MSIICSTDDSKHAMLGFVHYFNEQLMSITYLLQSDSSHLNGRRIKKKKSSKSEITIGRVGMSTSPVCTVQYVNTLIEVGWTAKLRRTAAMLKE